MAVVIGHGASSRLADLLSVRGVESVALFSGHQSFARSGAEEAILPQLAPYSVDRHEVRVVNPTAEDVLEALEEVQRGRFDVIVAVGGGSVIDLAKVVALCLEDPDAAMLILTGAASPAAVGTPVIALPTTAGSGAEMTSFATVYIDGAKHSVAHQDLRPVEALVDPDLTRSMSPHLAAVTGLDALAHAMESMWSVGSTVTSYELARKALRQVWQNLPAAVSSPQDEQRFNMAEGSNLAGRAIDISRTTASHALSYGLTSQFGVPHGHAAAITLPAMLLFNAGASSKDTPDPRGLDHVKRVIDDIASTIGKSGPEEASSSLASFIGDLGLPTRLGELGVPEEALPDLARSANLDRLRNNPRRVDEASALDLLRQVH